MLSAAVSGEKTFFVFFFNTLSLMICCVPDVLQALNKQVIGAYETSGYPQPQLSTDKGGELRACYTAIFQCKKWKKSHLITRLNEIDLSFLGGLCGSIEARLRLTLDGRGHRAKSVLRQDS